MALFIIPFVGPVFSSFTIKIRLLGSETWFSTSFGSYALDTSVCVVVSADASSIEIAGGALVSDVAAMI